MKHKFLFLILVAVTLITACSSGVSKADFEGAKLAQAAQVAELKNQQATQVALLEKLLVAPTEAPATSSSEEEKEIEPAATPQTIPAQAGVVPVLWFSNHEIEFGVGLTVAYDCETGARAWQGFIPAMQVPKDEFVIRMDNECEQFLPGSEYPGGIGTVWFNVPIEGTMGQKGNCPCEGTDCSD